MSLQPSRAILKQLAGRTVLVDTNAVVYLTERVPEYGEVAHEVFRALEEGAFFGVFSVLTVAEVMAGPLRHGRPELAREAREYLVQFPNTVCQPIDTAVLSAVGENPGIRWDRLRTMDSLIIACGLVRGVDRILSNDLRWRRAINKDLLVPFDVSG